MPLIRRLYEGLSELQVLVQSGRSRFAHSSGQRSVDVEIFGANAIEYCDALLNRRLGCRVVVTHPALHGAVEAVQREQQSIGADEFRLGGRGRRTGNHDRRHHRWRLHRAYRVSTPDHEDATVDDETGCRHQATDAQEDEPEPGDDSKANVTVPKRERAEEEGVPTRLPLMLTLSRSPHSGHPWEKRAC